MSQSISGTGTTGTSSSNSATNSALSSLTDNYQSFLQMLLTQLQNQDPTSPMDSSQFTSELVQFAGVEQQINTNTNLTQLIQLTQDNTTVQSTQLVGKQVQVTSSQLSLQNSTAAIAYTTAADQPVIMTVTNSTGQQLYTTTVAASQGSNTWTWNGQTTSGTTAPDGAYTVTASAVASDGSTSTLPFTVVGTVTGVQNSSGTEMVDLGQLQVDMTAITSVNN